MSNDTEIGHLDPTLRGVFTSGYSSEEFTKVAYQIREATGVELVCVWEYFDDAGYGGNSEFYINRYGALHDLVGPLWPWLSTAPDDPDATEEPGDPTGWSGGFFRLLGDIWGDGLGNYAMEARR